MYVVTAAAAAVPSTTPGPRLPPHLLPATSSSKHSSQVEVVRPPAFIFILVNTGIYHVMVLDSINIDGSRIVCVFQQAFGTTHRELWLEAAATSAHLTVSVKGGALWSVTGRAVAALPCSSSSSLSSSAAATGQHQHQWRQYQLLLTRLLLSPPPPITNSGGGSNNWKPPKMRNIQQ